jgi:DNA-binding NarL/FixJ family response regulator
MGLGAPGSGHPLLSVRELMAELEGSAPVRVVIADDDGAFLESLRALIDAQPELQIVGTARDGLEAIELTATLEPDAVVIDPHMPRLDGVTTIALRRRDHPNICLIALTGDAAPALHRAADEAGADGVFVKGEFLEKLLARLVSARGAQSRQPS